MKNFIEDVKIFAGVVGLLLLMTLLAFMLWFTVEGMIGDDTMNIFEALGYAWERLFN